MSFFKKQCDFQIHCGLKIKLLYAYRVRQSEQKRGQNMIYESLHFKI